MQKDVRMDKNLKKIQTNKKHTNKQTLLMLPKWVFQLNTIKKITNLNLN